MCIRPRRHIITRDTLIPKTVGYRLATYYYYYHRIRARKHGASYKVGRHDAYKSRTVCNYYINNMRSIGLQVHTL